jgi:hypothetical protein
VVLYPVVQLPQVDFKEALFRRVASKVVRRMECCRVRNSLGDLGRLLQVVDSRDLRLERFKAVLHLPVGEAQKKNIAL